MPHINLPNGLPGITGPLTAFPETAVHLNGLAHQLLRGESSLTPAEREMIATYVSAGNECYFCTNSHAAAAEALLGENASQLYGIVRGMERTQPEALTGDAKLVALLRIADMVRVDAHGVTPEAVEAARLAGADDKAIHDTVLIAAAFCMFNRYVDGLATLTPTDPTLYKNMGAMLAKRGYAGSAERPK